MANSDLTGQVAVVTGASSGIGWATAKVLWQEGMHVVLAARRRERLAALAEELAGGPGASVIELDVSERASCERFALQVLAAHGAPHVLVNNAGLARGLGPVITADEADWREMFEANVMGLMRLTRAFLPAMLERGRGDIVQMSSIAGVQPYANGAAYCASKAAVESFAFALRRELLGSGVRQVVIQPGMVDTEFSEVRFHGDKNRADGVYRGLMPLYAEDVAECVRFAVTRPPHVSVQTLLVTPSAQATATEVFRKENNG